jgi:D-xylose transport system substrate-binding protein
MRTNRRSALAVVAALALSVGAVACGGDDDGGSSGSTSSSGAKSGGGGGEKSGTIALLLPETKTTRYEEQDKPLFEAKVKALCPDCKLIYQNANQDAARQQQQAEAAITNGAKVLVLDAVDAKAAVATVNRAKAAGIPVIAYDRLIKDSDLDMYVSFDNVRVGELQAQFVVDQLRGKGTIVRIYGSKTDNNAAQFKQGQDHVLKPFIDRGDITVVHEDWADDWKPENAKRIMNAAITAKGTAFDAVLASNDGTAGGAIQALTEEGLAGKKIVTGQDAELVACQRIVAGTQAMSIYKPLKRLASSAAELAVKLGRRQVVVANQTTDNGKIAVPSLLNEVVTVTRANMADTVVKDGFHPYDEVYRGTPEASRPPRVPAQP